MEIDCDLHEQRFEKPMVKVSLSLPAPKSET